MLSACFCFSGVCMFFLKGFLSFFFLRIFLVLRTSGDVLFLALLRYFLGIIWGIFSRLLEGKSK